MAQLRFPLLSGSRPQVSHVRAPRPIHFPDEEEVPEGYTHLIVRTFLFRMLRFALGPEHTVGSDQFVYWLATNPRRCLSPDVFVRVGTPQRSFGSWKTWELGGAPDLAVEIISPNEGDGVAWDEKIARYHELGVKELVRFDPEEPEGRRLRVWDRVRGDLVEREVAADRSPCLTLGLDWIVLPVEGEPVGLRLVDGEGRLLEVPEEAEARARRAEASRAEVEAAKAQTEAARAEAEAKARALAEERVRELEAELARRG